MHRSKHETMMNGFFDWATVPHGTHGSGGTRFSDVVWINWYYYITFNLTGVLLNNNPLFLCCTKRLPSRLEVMLELKKVYWKWICGNYSSFFLAETGLHLIVGALLLCPQETANVKTFAFEGQKQCKVSALDASNNLSEQLSLLNWYGPFTHSFIEDQSASKLQKNDSFAILLRTNTILTSLGDVRSVKTKESNVFTAPVTTEKLSPCEWCAGPWFIIWELRAFSPILAFCFISGGKNVWKR